jgi:hypothetical protein
MNARSRTLIGLASMLCLGLAACHDDDAPQNNGDTGSPVSIGGSVSGATGALSLQNSDGNTLSVAGNGPFTFATKINTGATYNVTVTTPPASQTCTVANGIGTASVSNITNIAVTCTTNQYSLGGTVSGLGAGKNVVLMSAPSVPVSNSVTVSANGAFTFPQTLAGGTAYEVFITTQPMNQVCTVTNDTGSIAGANVTNIAVTCVDSSASARNWGSAATVAADADPQDQNWMRAPDVAFDSAGNAFAIWDQDTVGAPGTELYVSRYVAGSGWQTPTLMLNNYVNPMSSYRRRPRIAVAANGNAAAVWVQNAISVAASLYTPGSGWSDPVMIWQGTDNNGNAQPGDIGAVEPRVAIDESGNVLVVWEDYVNQSLGALKYNRYTPGIGWTESQLTASTVGGVLAHGRDPRLAMLPNGNAIALWKQDGNGPFDQSQLWSSRYDMTGNTWTTPQVVDSQDPANPLYGRIIPNRANIVIDASGTATALWAQYDGTRMQIVFNRLTGNTWGTPSIVETDNTVLLSNAYDPRATIDGNGNIMAMWLQVDQEEGHYVANRYVPGTGWGTRQTIGAYVPVGHVAPDTAFELVSNADGDTVAVWTLVSGIGEENVPEPVYLSANEYNAATGSWGTEKVIDRNGSEPLGDILADAMSPSLGVDASGNAMAVWLQQNSAVEGIRFNRFE